LILVDTSVWVEHLKTGHPRLAALLGRGLVLGHPWVVGELALGHLHQRGEVLALLGQLPQATIATPVELLTFINDHSLDGAGIGYVDAQLLAATRLTPDASLWTNDKRLDAAATRMGIASDQRIYGGKGP
jgi:hypothetical protein